MTTETIATANDNPNITELRSIMMQQLRDIKSAKGDQLEAELSKGKAINALSQTMINSARVEVDYLKETGQLQSTFLDTQAQSNTSKTPGITKNSADTIKTRNPATPFTGLAQ